MGARKVTPDTILFPRFRETWEARNARQEETGRQWYPVAHEECERIADVSGHSVETIVYTVAALSPNVPWGQNVRMARRLATARRFRNPGTFPKTARDAWRCLQGDYTANTGQKREAFARAILGPHAVTIDRHMIALVRHPYLGISPQQYRHYAEAVTRFALELGEEPRIVQAILWTVQRERAA